MLSADNIRRINNQIKDELSEAGRFVNSDEEKAAALDRALKLKQLLDPNPSVDELVEKLAAALSSPTTVHVQAPSSAADLLADAIRGFRR